MAYDRRIIPSPWENCKIANVANCRCILMVTPHQQRPYIFRKQRSDQWFPRVYTPTTNVLNHYINKWRLGVGGVCCCCWLCSSLCRYFQRMEVWGSRVCATRSILNVFYITLKLSFIPLSPSFAFLQACYIHKNRRCLYGMCRQFQRVYCTILHMVLKSIRTWYYYCSYKFESNISLCIIVNVTFHLRSCLKGCNGWIHSNLIQVGFKNMRMLQWLSCKLVNWIVNIYFWYAQVMLDKYKKPFLITSPLLSICTHTHRIINQ